MVSKGAFMRDTVRPIALAMVAIAFGSLLSLLLEVLLKVQLPRLFESAITFAFAALAAFYLFPSRLKLPFQEVDLRAYLRHLGFYLPLSAWKHILLGCLLAACTLSGMWIGSLASGRYQLDRTTVTITQVVFSINPGLWEEFFFRGVVMFVLLGKTRSLRRAALIQTILFGLAHIKGFGLWDWLDVISVTILAAGFTYTAYKTRTLLAGVVFHFLHDALLFLPQLPGGEYVGFAENIPFYASLWVMVGVACAVVKVSSDALGVRAAKELYSTDPMPTA